VREPIAKMVAVTRNENLSLTFQSAECFGMDDARVVPLKLRAKFIALVRKFTPRCISESRIWREPNAFAFFEITAFQKHAEILARKITIESSRSS
jgi:hypothetical protein